MTSPDHLNLGLFPLGLVLLPGERVPLHIFEPRYRALVADCTLAARPFVISVATDAGVAKIGCTAHVEALVRRFSDGRLNIVVTGGDRVEIVEQTVGASYITALVTPVADVDVAVDAALAAQVARQFAELTTAVAGAAHTPATGDGVPLSYAIAGAIELEPAPKQGLLECRDENTRLAMLRDALSEAAAGVDRAEVAAKRASSNGKPTL